ncbi:MAG TPA: hypothetical protein VFH06_04730 [Candidatus Saccharimonadales bacterium]|nr:hypothetical protein [Candidatus Saccharimonadales bacterium]
MAVFDDKGNFETHPEDADELWAEIPAKAPYAIGWGTLAGVIGILIWIVVATSTSWFDLGMTILVGLGVFAVCFVVAIFWIAWFPNRRDDN